MFNNSIAKYTWIVLLIVSMFYFFIWDESDNQKLQRELEQRNKILMSQCTSNIVITGSTTYEKSWSYNNQYFSCVRKLEKDLSVQQTKQIPEANASSIPDIINFRNDFQCALRTTTTHIELHYTGEDYDNQNNNDAKLLAIWNAHVSSKWRVKWSGIGYHYVVAKDGTIYNTRNVECVWVADAEWDKVYLPFGDNTWEWSSHNAERIHISFIGSDKPNSKQTDSLVYLTRMLLDKYSLHESSITSHGDEAKKSKKETLAYWYWWRGNFIKLIPESNVVPIVDSTYIEWKKIYRNWWALDYLQYAYDMSHWDMDFILTIEAESRWDLNSVWDNWNSYWLCQLHGKWHKDKQDEYKSYSDFWKVDYCYRLYTMWKKDWVIFNMLHGYAKRGKEVSKFTFQ